MTFRPYVLWSEDLQSFLAQTICLLNRRRDHLISYQENLYLIFLMTVWRAQIRFLSNTTQATFVYGPRTDTYPTFCNATSIWTVMSHFIQLLHHWSATDITILCWRSVGRIRAVDCSQWSLLEVAFKLECDYPCKQISKKSELSNKMCSVNVAKVPHI